MIQKFNESEFTVMNTSLLEINSLPTLNVGADETQVSLCWHCDKSTAKAEVTLLSLIHI